MPIDSNLTCSKCGRRAVVLAGGLADGRCLDCWGQPRPRVVSHVVELDDRWLDARLQRVFKDPSPLATPVTLWVQKWEERESGWGSRPDGYTLHLKREDVALFLRDMRAEEYKTHRGAVPDEYSTTSGDPYEWVTTDAALVEVVRASELGVKRHGPPPQPKPGVDPGGWMPVKTITNREA